MINGALIIHKEAGYTSFDVVAKLRGILKEKKIGHAGTLDPDATGVLPVFIGKATKMIPYLSDHDKTYETVFCLGRETDTYDSSGTIISEKEVDVSPERITEVILSFIGPQKQIPPMYSAKKVGGKKLYELARAGETVERKACDITIHSIEILDIRLPYVSMEVSCSSGTYIRSLIHDIGAASGCGACMEKLVRTKACGFSLDESMTLSEAEALKNEGELIHHILLPDALLPFEHVICDPKAESLLRNGNKIPLDMASDLSQRTLAADQPVLLYTHQERFVGIYHRTDDLLIPEKIFYTEEA